MTVAALLLAASARAQNVPAQMAPLPPLQQQGGPNTTLMPVTRGARAVGQGAGYPMQAGPAPGGLPQGRAGPSPAVTGTTLERPNIWIPAQIAKLQALDKVNAQAGDLAIRVGQSGTFGSLTITVKSCMVRPPDQPSDAAAYLNVTDSHPDSPTFAGWLLQAEPSVSMMQHPIYDLRVIGCT